MPCNIRRLTPEDYDDIIRIWADAGLPYKPRGRDARSRITKEMKRKDTGFFGMFENGTMVGVGLATHDGRKGWISRVAVDPECRGRGKGGKLVRACEEFLKECGAEVVSCLIEEHNLPSMSMFQKAGYSHWDSILYFSKRDSDEV